MDPDFVPARLMAPEGLADYCYYVYYLSLTLLSLSLLLLLSVLVLSLLLVLLLSLLLLSLLLLLLPLLFLLFSLKATTYLEDLSCFCSKARRLDRNYNSDDNGRQEGLGEKRALDNC